MFYYHSIPGTFDGRSATISYLYDSRAGCATPLCKIHANDPSVVEQLARCLNDAAAVGKLPSFRT